jgi:hypothetical protein
MEKRAIWSDIRGDPLGEADWTAPGGMPDEGRMNLAAALVLSLLMGSAAVDTTVTVPRTPDYWEAWVWCS